MERGSQINANDRRGHIELYAELRAIHATAKATNEEANFDSNDILRIIIESRLDHMSTRFWKKNGKMQDRYGAQLKFEDLMQI